MGMQGTLEYILPNEMHMPKVKLRTGALEFWVRWEAKNPARPCCSHRILGEVGSKDSEEAVLQPQNLGSKEEAVLQP